MTPHAAVVRWSRRWGILAPLAAIGLLGIYLLAPRRADLTRFDPAGMARLETSMWRDYYEKRYPALFLNLYVTARQQQGFSPWDSARIALAAARAAKSFQPSTSRAGAEAAIPMLIDYFRILAKGAPVRVDVAAAARAELAWWQARREAVAPADYGLMVARVSTLCYGVDDARVHRSGLLRAEAMAYRDGRGARMTEADWAAIEHRLRSAYRLLKEAVSSTPP